MATIKTPGKFEGQTDFVEAMWNEAGSACCDREFYDGDTLISCFKITAADRAKFPDDIGADAVGRWLCLWETDQGFVESAIHDSADLDRIEAECMADEGAGDDA